MKTAFRFSILIFILCGLVYPLAITGLGQWLFPQQANGSLILNHQKQVIGSELLGQAFSQPQYFHPRSSANGYDGANSGGSNYGATSQKLIDRATGEAEKYRQENKTASVPLDAITASASGLDPHISLENALAQAERVAKTRGIDQVVLEKTIQTEANNRCDWMAEASHACGIVNVLKLNLALDDLSKAGGQRDTR